MRPAVVLALLVFAVGVAGTAAGKTGSVSAFCAKHGNAGHTGTPDGHVYLGDPPVEMGGDSRPLQACETVHADADGQVSFNLDAVQTGITCTVKPNGVVEVDTDKKTLVSFVKKKTWCATKKKHGFFKAGKLLLRGDPLFEVTVADNGAVSVAVAKGFVLAGPQKPNGTPAPGSVIVGPNEQSTSKGGPEAKTPQHVAASALAALNASDLAKLLPPPAYARPSSRTALEASPTLQRIGRSRQLVVGLGPQLSDSASLAFVKAYFGFLAKKWLLRRKNPVVYRTGIAPARARDLLARSRIDLFLTQSPPRRTLSAPFFAAGGNWQFVVKADTVFLHALSTFLESTLDTGDYDRLYRASLAGQPPVYRALAPLLFPAVRCIPRPHADLTSVLDLSLGLTASPSGPLAPGAKVVQTAAVTNTGRRVVDCVTLGIQVFGGLPLNDRALVDRGCTQTFPAGAGEVDLSCELGRMSPGQKKSLQVVVQPAAGAARAETCAAVDADESGGLPEVNRADNSACAELVYRTAPLVVGAAEDKVQYPASPGANNPLDRLDQQAKTELLKQAGFGAAIATAYWIPGRKAPTNEQVADLNEAAAAANANGMQFVVAVYNYDDRRPPKLTTAQTTPATAPARAEFAAYAAALVRSVHGVGALIVGNEPNNGAFWAPQYGSHGSDVAAPAYEALLAATYDAVKAVDPAVTVIGGALAPRGAERPKAGRDSRSPVTFIADLGGAYAKSRRPAPIMDAFALHPLPESPEVPPTTQHPAPSTVLGIADYPFLVSLLGRAFDGSPQRGSTLDIYYTEYATEGTARQSDFYRQAIALASCQPTVRGIFIFHAFDQPDSPWQSGVYRFDGRAKTSLASVRDAALAAQSRLVSSCPPLPR